MILKNIELVPVESLLEAQDNSTVYMKRYWLVYEGNILRSTLTGAWQCNQNRQIIEMFLSQNQDLYEGCEVVFFDYLYIPK